MQPSLCVHDDDDDETGDTDIRAAWAGGADGLLVTAEVVDHLVTLLSQPVVAYIVLEKCNNPALVQQHVENLGLSCETVITRRARTVMMRQE